MYSSGWPRSHRNLPVSAPECHDKGRGPIPSKSYLLFMCMPILLACVYGQGPGKEGREDNFLFPIISLHIQTYAYTSPTAVYIKQIQI